MSQLEKLPPLFQPANLNVWPGPREWVLVAARVEGISRLGDREEKGDVLKGDENICAAAKKNLGIFGGADGIRTHDLLDAIEARSQLRHGPTGGTLESLPQIGEWLGRRAMQDCGIDCLLAPPAVSSRCFAPRESMELWVTVLQVFYRGEPRGSSRMQASWQNSLFWAQQVA